jgi:hypothetical protein
MQEPLRNKARNCTEKLSIRASQHCTWEQVQQFQYTNVVKSHGAG